MASRAMPTHNGPPAKSSTEAPNPTLYITNLPDKIRKPDLRMALYMLFTTYGPVLDVVAVKTAKTRGQAHIVFRDIQSSTLAMRALQGFDFFGKELVSLFGIFCSESPNQADFAEKIQYARGRSNVFKRLEGFYKAPNTSANATTEGQQSIFTAPIPSSTATSAAPGTLKASDGGVDNGRAESEGPQGVKRRREDESDEEDAPMDEDDDDVSMEASSDED